MFKIPQTQDPNIDTFVQGDGSINVREGLNGMARCWEDMASVLMYGTLKLEVIEGENTWREHLESKGLNTENVMMRCTLKLEATSRVLPNLTT
jgi:hypothetical protein